MGPRVKGLLASVTQTVWMVGVLLRAGMIPLVRPDRYVRMIAVVRRGVTATTGIALAAARAPRRTAFVDERGALTWAELDAGCDAFAVGLTCGGILDVYVEKVSRETFPELGEIAADIEAGRPVALPVRRFRARSAPSGWTTPCTTTPSACWRAAPTRR